MTDPNSEASLPTGTIDLTNVVDRLQSSFVTWGVDYVFALTIATPWLAWLALPGLSAITKAIVKGVLTFLSNSAIMVAFFMNTAIRKGDQAEDYIKAVSAKEALPSTATDKEYEAYEKAEMLAFRNFVSLTN